MRILLFAGTEHTFIAGIIEKKRHIAVNNKSLAVGEADDYILNYKPSYDMILVTDGALAQAPDENARALDSLTKFQSRVVIVTRDFLFKAPNDMVTVVISEWLRPLEADFDAALMPLRAEKKPDAKTAKRKWKKENKGAGKAGELPSAVYSLASSRAVAVTGHRGSGVTSTAASVSLSAGIRGLKTIFIDLDLDYRAANLYFGEFNRQTEDDEISASLIRLLAQPQRYDALAVNSGGIWVASLGYDFDDRSLLEQQCTEQKIIGLITALKHSFDLVVIDFPLDRFARAPSVLNSIDSIALCMENNIYSAFTTIRNIALGFGARGEVPYFASKSKLVVTKFNDESVFDGELLMPERLSELIVNEGFCEEFASVLPVAGQIPYISRFDRQIETDVPIIHTDESMKSAYDGILLRLLGAR